MKSVPKPAQKPQNKKSKPTIKGEVEKLESKITSRIAALDAKHSRKTVVNLTLAALVIETIVSYLI